MSSRTAPEQRPPSLGRDSRYQRIWTTVAFLAAGVWMAVAVLQTPRVPLLGVAAGLGAVGGILFVRAPAATSRGTRQYLTGALAVAGLAVVTVGIGHHLTVGLTVVALLAGSSPTLLRWIAGE
jgi:hypothetical protein